MNPRYQISASKDGSLGKSFKSPIFEGEYAQAQALKWAHDNCQKCRSITLLKEDQWPINAGKFFLDRILK